MVGRRMVKKRGKVPRELSPSSSCFPDDEYMPRTRLKRQNLLQDYEDSIKEIEAKNKKLQETKKKKLRLLGEIKFLRGKFKCFAKNPSQRTRCRIKKQSYKIIDRKYIVAEAPSTSNSGVLDLNQVSFPVIAEKNSEGMDYKVDREPLNIEKPKERIVDGSTVVNDIKLSVCRDLGNNSNRVGKRKITWQDQVALKV
ncbi:hypothetical protein ACMD2_14199 [Ananas comosus]|uniref:Uncharacterized protein n=1 Tax=Ananas comosus TaxID=4615 RepID=A0A199VAT2_ANACO|nr:hypothetical protein ACMD2_14199 [Ananas comosus]